MTIKNLTLTWIILLLLTFSGSGLGEYASPGFWVTLSIACITALKGRLLIDRFMELGSASPVIRRTVYIFGLLTPMLMLLTSLLGPQLAQLTQLPD